jgi:hypothetical protein
MVIGKDISQRQEDKCNITIKNKRVRFTLAKPAVP